jgi:hypothetical protein
MKAVLFCALLVGAAVVFELKVTLNVFSSSPDPSWTVQGELAARMLADLTSAGVNEQDGAVMRPIPWYRLGYRGFEVEVRRDEETVVFAVYNNAIAERLLLASAPPSVVSDSVGMHVGHEVVRLMKLRESGEPMPMDMVPPLDGTAPCDLPVRGPDNGTIYDPQRENCGFFVTHCSANNCYNYGNDIVTDTFAQPGRGSGQKWSYNTCDDIRASATRDGLVWAGTTLPTENPAQGHYVALFIWPNTNFHWIRFDSVPKGFWSHKPGGTPVRNIDNNGKKITDPSHSDFSPWSQFCGYMTTIPSTARIG